MTIKGAAPKIFALVRVSSTDQKSGYGPEGQLTEIKGGAVRIGGEVFKIRHIAESASDPDAREQFEKFIAEAIALHRRGEIDTVMAAMWDRLGRTGALSSGYHIESLRREGIAVRVADEDQDIDPNAPDWEKQVAEHLSEGRSDNVKRTKRTVRGRVGRAKSGKLGTGQYPWPYDYESRRQVGDSSTGVPVKNAERAAVVSEWAARIMLGDSLNSIEKDMNASAWLSPSADKSVREIMRQQGIGREHAIATLRAKREASGKTALTRWSVRTIKQLLDNPLVTEGKAYFNIGGERILAHHDPDLAILTGPEVEAINRRIARNRALSPGNTQRWHPPISYFISCHCGRKPKRGYNDGRPIVRCRHCRVSVCGVDHSRKSIHLFTQAKMLLTRLITSPETFATFAEEAINSNDNREGIALQIEGKEAERASIPARIKNQIELADKLGAMGVTSGMSETAEKIAMLEQRGNQLTSEIDDLRRQQAGRIRFEVDKAAIDGLISGTKDILDGDTSDREWVTLFDEWQFKATIQPGKGGVVFEHLRPEFLLPHS